MNDVIARKAPPEIPAVIMPEGYTGKILSVVVSEPFPVGAFVVDEPDDGVAFGPLGDLACQGRVIDGVRIQGIGSDSRWRAEGPSVLTEGFQAAVEVLFHGPSQLSDDPAAAERTTRS